MTTPPAPVYSQHGEQEALLAHFGERTGRLLDIGAFDGKAFSNFLALIERGWEAVLVEPSARAFDKLRERHEGNPKVRCVQALIVPEDQVREPNLRLFWQTGDALSTTEEAHRAKWAAQKVPFTETWLPALSLYRLLQWSEAMARPFDFISIDTEQTSVPLWHATLHHLPVASRPEVACIEHDALPVQRPGYERIYFDGNNIILRRA